VVQIVVAYAAIRLMWQLTFNQTPTKGAQIRCHARPAAEEITEKRTV